LETDPTEQRNVAGAHPEKVRELKDLLTQHNAEQATPLWSAAVEMPVSIDKTLVESESPEDEYVYWPN
jgi:uncharacterized sulfatase